MSRMSLNLTYDVLLSPPCDKLRFRISIEDTYGRISEFTIASKPKRSV